MNRLPRPSNDDKPDEVTSFFLACEFRPGGPHWGVVDGFAYDVKPAYIRGSLGMIAYDPPAYAIVEEGEGCQPLMGYLMTITCPDMVALLDRAKGHLGESGYNCHIRRVVNAYTDQRRFTPAWCYIISGQILNAYQSIETVEYGLTGKDPKLSTLLEKILGKPK